MLRNYSRRIGYTFLTGILYLTFGSCCIAAPISIEGENFTRNVSQGGKSWTTRLITNASGGSVVLAGPNVGTVRNVDFVTSSPRLDYRVFFPKSGVYFVWVRGFGGTRSDDSVHLGLDGKGAPSATSITGFPQQLNWSNRTLDAARARVSVPTAGTHIINVWMREDGFAFDKIVLARSSLYVPVGLGPTTAEHTTALLTWQAPTINTDGTAINDLAGFVIYMATERGGFTANDIITKIPAFTYSGGSNYSHTMRGLKSGTYFFAVSAYNNAGEESRLSDIATKTVSP